MDLYHASIRLPKIPMPVGRAYLYYTRHALNAARDDSIRDYELPKFIDLRYAKVIEVGVEENMLVKVLYRVAFDGDFDLCLVVVPGGAKWRVISLWLNEVNDNHRTLDHSRYVH